MTGSGSPLVISRIRAIIFACHLIPQPERMTLKAALFKLYWQLCQYPWHLFFNIGVSGLLYLLSLAIGPHLTRSFVRAKAGRYPLKYFFADRVLTCAAGTMLLVLGAALVVRENNVVFIILGINYFFWFLFFPFHLLVHGLRGKRIELSKVLTAAAILAVAYLASFYFPEHLVVRRYRIATDRLTGPIRIVHLSDIHCERYGAREARIAAAVNRLKPDLILVTGDLFNTPWNYNVRGFQAAVRFVSQLQARLGIYAVTGHHDALGGTEKVNEALDGRIHYLNHEWRRLNDQGLNLTLFGAIQGWHKFYPDTIDTVAGNYRIFFAHSPVWIKDFKSGDFDLALFGHTHAGQIYAPFLLSLVLGPYVHGWYRKNQTRIYVHAGLGMDGFLAPRIRWFTYPEIVVIDLAPAAK